MGDPALRSDLLRRQHPAASVLPGAGTVDLAPFGRSIVRTCHGRAFLNRRALRMSSDSSVFGAEGLESAEGFLILLVRVELGFGVGRRRDRTSASRIREPG